MSESNLDRLIDLKQFVEDNKPNEPFEPRGDEHVVYAHPFERLTIQREGTSDIGYGLCREDQLAEAGVCGAEHDSRSFAENLYKALEPHLSIRMLRDLVMVFSRGLDENEAERKAAIGK